MIATNIDEMFLLAAFCMSFFLQNSCGFSKFMFQACRRRKPEVQISKHVDLRATYFLRQSDPSKKVVPRQITILSVGFV